MNQIATQPDLGDALISSLVRHGQLEERRKVSTQRAVLESLRNFGDSHLVNVGDLLERSCAGFDGAAIAQSSRLCYRERETELVTREFRTNAHSTSSFAVTYVATETLPFRVSGYNTRTLGLSRALSGVGPVEVVTPPGFPWTLPNPQGQEIIPQPHWHHWRYTFRDVQHRHKPTAHQCESVPYCAERIREHAYEVADSALTLNATVIHAASTAANGAVASIAARELGLPCSYEVRGLWMLSELSRDPSFIGSQELTRQLRAEVLVANDADFLFTISNGVAEFLTEWGLQNRATILPNGVDTDLFRPLGPSHEVDEGRTGPERMVVGFISNFERTEYEGVETILFAMALLNQFDDSGGVQLLLVGDGHYKKNLLELAGSLGLRNSVRSLPAVPYSEVPSLYAEVDVCVFPRRRDLVTELVPPVKPLEAMACGKPVIVSDCTALTDLIRDGAPVLSFPQGDPVRLAELLRDLRLSSSARDRLGLQARDWVVANRDWRIIASRMTQTFESGSIQKPK